MNKLFKFCLMAIVVMISIAGCRELSRQPGSAVYLRPLGLLQNYFSQSAGDWTVTPNWMVSQWGIPAELSGSQTVAPGADWNVANQYARVKYIASSKTYELAQNGQGAGLQCGTEFDLFLSPVDSNFPQYPQGIAASKTLDQLDNLAFQIGFQATYEDIQNRCRPTNNVDYVNHAISFILHNNVTGQTLFYQILLRQAGNGATLPNMTWCPNNNDPNTAHMFCVGDDISYVNGNLKDANLGQHVLYQADMLARLKQVLQSGYHRGDGEVIDGNISHWKLDQMYMGSMIQGGANVTAQWDSFCLLEQQKGDSTSNKVCQS